MVDIKADTPQMWSKEDLIDFLRSAQGRETIRSILLEDLAHNEPVKEAVARVAIQAAPQVMRTVEQIQEDLEVESQEGSHIPVVPASLWDHDTFDLEEIGDYFPEQD